MVVCMISKEKFNKIKDIVTVIALCIILVVSVVLLYKALGNGNNSMLSNQTNSYTISINDKYSNLSGKVEFITINSSEHDYNIEYVTDEVCKQLNAIIDIECSDKSGDCKELFNIFSNLGYIPYNEYEYYINSTDNYGYNTPFSNKALNYLYNRFYYWIKTDNQYPKYTINNIKIVETTKNNFEIYFNTSDNNKRISNIRIGIYGDSHILQTISFNYVEPTDIKEP